MAREHLAMSYREMIPVIAALLVVAIVALYYVMPPGGREFLVTATFVMIAIVLWAVMLASFVVGK
jgi:hypothetical protein